MTDGKSIVFAVPTRKGSTREGESGVVRVEASARDQASAIVELEAVPGEDVVRLELVGGPELYLNPENARQLFQAQESFKPVDRSAGRGAEGAVIVPTRLGWRGLRSTEASRGMSLGEVGQVVVRAFEVVKETVSSKGANVVAALAAEALDRRAPHGLRRLGRRHADTRDPGDVTLGDKPLLVLIHGTASTTLEAFQHLWAQPELIERLLNAFDLYGFDHPTLRVSPLQNAVDLAKQLPRRATVQFLTHSRGGLVAEAIAQLAGGSAEESSAFDDPKYARQRQELAELRAALAERELRIARIVRVACPARGTLLASNRLDAYLSVLRWGLKLAQVPVAPELTEFLIEVARRRMKPEELPGLEAMTPTSAFIRWMHEADTEIEGDLRVVAGDLQGDSLSSWLKVLVSDAFYWTDNDLIVQTRSMYGGRPRKGGASFFLDRGGKVTHFNYFSNQSTALAVVEALTRASPADFQTIGRLSSEGISATGTRGGTMDVVAASRSKAKPAVIVVPGILGSYLKADGVRIWVSPFLINGLRRLKLGGAAAVTPDGWLESYYDPLVRYLAASHEVIPFPFDWRLPVEVEAERLARTIREALADRTEPVRVLAHSQGGLVARAVEKVAPEVWNDFLKHERGRLLMLGVPHGGSWVPMQVLSGDNLFGNLIANVGILFNEAEARALFASLPGVLQLQAGLLDEKLKLHERETWRKLAKNDRARFAVTLPWHGLPIQLQCTEWGIPTKDALDRAYELHRWLATQDLRKHGDRVVTVIGKAPRTLSGYRTDDAPPSFDYLQTDRGDGTVPFSSGLLPGVRAYQVDVDHSKMPRPPALHPGYASLLERGNPGDAIHFTSLFSTRGGASALPDTRTEVAPRAARLRGWTEDALDAVDGLLSLPAATASAASRAASPALSVSVVNGDLTFVKEPLMLGHYRSTTLTGAERVIDRFLKGTMSEALRLRRYPTAPRESDVFANEHPNPEDPKAVPRPAAVIIVGLGAEGELSAEQLTLTVRQGVIGYAQTLAGSPGAASSFEMAATLIGSGGMGIQIATSARAVAQGVRAANERLLKEGWPVVERLRFIELYEDRATEALRELLAAAEQQPAAFVVNPKIEMGTSPLPRPESSSYRGADYDMVSALDGPRQDGESTIVFTIDARRARSEVRSSTSQLGLVRALISSAEADRRADRALGKTLFRMLVPAELDSFFGNSEAVVLEVDDGTAGIPWEFLSVEDDDDDPHDVPWAIRAKLIRKLHTAEFRENPRAAGQDAKLLVFGDPLCDDRSKYPSLEGAQREARAVAAALGTPNVHIGANALEMVNALLSHSYAIVHIAGHGKEDGSGVVMSGDQVFGALLVRSMRRLPDLVFVNCCHSGRQSAGSLPGRAATLASALICAGVRCVIATGWAVDDDAAEHFANVFYGHILAQKTFIEATTLARESTWREYPESNTWAAYQCYGDPEWVFAGGDVQREAGPLTRPDLGEEQSRTPARSSRPREAPIVSESGLLVALKTLATLRTPESKSRLQRLEDQFGPEYGHAGSVAEAFGAAYADLGERGDAIRWYERAVQCEKGATFRSLEQLCNLTIRSAEEQIEAAYGEWESRRDADAFREAARRAKAAFAGRAEDLKRLAALHATSERTNLLASAWKRRAMTEYMIALVLPSPEAQSAAEEAVDRSRELYERATGLARERKLKNVGYAHLNALTAVAVLELVAGRKPPAADPSVVAEVRESLLEWGKAEPVFWPFAQAIELDLYVALCSVGLQDALPHVKKEFENLFNRMANPHEWATVRDQARFTLRPYAREPRAQPEIDAANELKAILEGYARVKP